MVVLTCCRKALCLSRVSSGGVGRAGHTALCAVRRVRIQDAAARPDQRSRGGLWGLTPLWVLSRGPKAKAAHTEKHRRRVV